MKYLPFLLCLFFITVSAQEKSGLVTSQFQKKAANSSLSPQVSYYVEINNGGFFKNIYVMTTDSTYSPDKFSIKIFFNNGTVRTIPAAFKKTADNSFTFDQKFASEDEDELAALTLNFDPVKKELGYRWNNKDKNDFSAPKIIKEFAYKKGNKFPVIKLDLDNTKSWSNAKKKKVIVINWFYTKSQPCADQVAELNKLVEKYKSKDVEFLSVVWDKDGLAAFLKAHPFSYLHGIAATQEIYDLMGTAIPRNIVVDKKGVIQYNHAGVGPTVIDDIDKAIEAGLQ